MSEPRAPTLAHSLLERRGVSAAAVSLCLLGPLVACASVALVSGRGAPVPALVVVGIPAALSLASAIVLWRRMPRISAIGGLGLLALLALVSSFGSSPLPSSSAASFALPSPERVPEGVVAYRIETGVIHRTASFGYRGGGLDTHRDFAMNAVLVTHPRGDVLVDTGLGANVRAHLAEMPLPFRLVTDLAPGQGVSAQFDAIGYDRARLWGALLTHAHWDHVSGAEDLGELALWVPVSERRFLDDGWITAIARRVPGARYRTFDFDGPPALHAPCSHDVHGDGAIVIVPVPGHTPGSVAVLVTQSDGRRFLLLGDLVWQREGVTEREERPWLTRLGDSDPASVRAQIVAIEALSRAHPEITLVPAHDPRGYEEMVPLGALRVSGPR